MVSLYNRKNFGALIIFTLVVFSFFNFSTKLALAINEPLDESEDTTKAFVPPSQPVLESKEFNRPDIWYSSINGSFSWNLPTDVIAVAISIATSSTSEAETVYNPPIDKVNLSFKNLSEGVQYLVVEFKNRDGWGVASNQEIKIDTLPPESLNISVKSSQGNNSFPVLNFRAEDKVSGIDYYQIYTDDNELTKLTPNEALFGYVFSKLVDGTYTVRVVAVDMAGNSTERTIPVVVSAGWSKVVEDIDETQSTTFTPSHFLISVLVILIIMFLVYLRYEYKLRALQDSKIKKETEEIKDQMVKIFSALRDEIYDQINSITKRPKLSKTEKNAVDGLNKALEVSETLIKKEVDDVSSLLK